MALESLFLLLKNLVIFSSYVTEKSSFPKPLSKEKENEYILRAEQGDKEAKEILIKHNLRLVAHIAKKYANYGDNDELISGGGQFQPLQGNATCDLCFALYRKRDSDDHANDKKTSLQRVSERTRRRG